LSEESIIEEVEPARLQEQKICNIKHTNPSSSENPGPSVTTVDKTVCAISTLLLPFLLNAYFIGS
jgi:hypothetical protein